MAVQHLMRNESFQANGCNTTQNSPEANQHRKPKRQFKKNNTGVSCIKVNLQVTLTSQFLANSQQPVWISGCECIEA